MKKEIKAIDVIQEHGSGDFILLHCVSGYPTPVEEINLDTITLLKKKFHARLVFLIILR